MQQSDPRHYLQNNIKIHLPAQRFLRWLQLQVFPRIKFEARNPRAWFSHLPFCKAGESSVQVIRIFCMSKRSVSVCSFKSAFCLIITMQKAKRIAMVENVLFRLRPAQRKPYLYSESCFQVTEIKVRKVKCRAFYKDAFR